MRALLVIIFLPFILLIAIPVGAVLIGLGAGLFGVVIGLFAAIFGGLVAFFATIFGGIFSIGGIFGGLLFSKILFILLIIVIITSLFNRNSANKKVTKQ